jgi:hypothetical protein
MNFKDQDIAAIQTLGYTQIEAQFLYLVAVHSGYFVSRQFLAFSGTKWGKRSNSFVAKLESRGHATWREYDRTGGVYHLFSKTLYRYIGKENLRNRRRHSVEFIRTRLLLLDFVLAHLDFEYLETESQKVQYFCQSLGLSKAILPAKTYEGGPHTEPTLRYFVDKFPLFLAPSSPAEASASATPPTTAPAPPSAAPSAAPSAPPSWSASTAPSLTSPWPLMSLSYVDRDRRVLPALRTISTPISRCFASLSVSTSSTSLVLLSISLPLNGASLLLFARRVKRTYRPRFFATSSCVIRGSSNGTVRSLPPILNG